MNFAAANRGAFVILVVAATMGASWLTGSMVIPDRLPGRPVIVTTEGDPAAPLPAGNVENGAALANATCSRCHSFTPSAQDSAGPSLFGVYGRPIGRQPGYTYSNGLMSLGGQWDDAHLNAWLRNPATFSPGTRMSFRGLPDVAERANIIAWLKTLH
ncbi:c-type cytochrome [Acetobacter sp.]|jgi:cytochrome c|uniref:c-type cytochrome n=1 Tax=Acetobacter sp. TaxID=440 RepID=UPI0025BF5260|nr:c-type cytochrome [Acetobacter sp.]MCH4090618.1 c-type cytochrome [Acetobacter sp.]MCI1300061.1 c-type cytochrome [Acetobacter sp.]MCI1316479.1 c-type cytochrome [Acetobacter sp.]